MSPTRKRKRNYEHSLNGSERGQENKGCPCKVAKVDPEVPQSENNSPRVRLPNFQVTTFLDAGLHVLLTTYPLLVC